jgi:hypothetical protein
MVKRLKTNTEFETRILMHIKRRDARKKKMMIKYNWNGRRNAPEEWKPISKWYTKKINNLKQSHKRLLKKMAWIKEQGSKAYEYFQYPLKFYPGNGIGLHKPTIYRGMLTKYCMENWLPGTTSWHVANWFHSQNGCSPGRVKAWKKQLHHRFKKTPALREEYKRFKNYMDQ